MDPIRREMLREAILRILDANGSRFGMPLSAIRIWVRHEGFQGLQPKEIEEELAYLEDKELIEDVNKLLSPENRAWRINATGRDFLAQNQR